MLKVFGPIKLKHTDPDPRGLESDPAGSESLVAYAYVTRCARTSVRERGSSGPQGWFYGSTIFI